MQSNYYSSSYIKSQIAYTVPRVKIDIATNYVPTPTVAPTTVSNQPSQAPTTAQVKGTVSLDEKQAYIMSGINDYRRAKGLPAVQPDEHTCAFATTRAGEIASNFNHDGFTNRINNKTLPYPSYHEVTENLAMTGDYKNVVNLWINSAGHAANMEKDTPYVCVAGSGNYYAYEGWRP